MTNTNDFRKYSYATDTNSLISSFNYTRGSQAPKRVPSTQEQERELKLREGGGVKSREQLHKEQRASRALTIKVAAVAVVCLLLIGAVLNSFAVKNQLTREIAKKEIAIANAESEYISLESKLNSLVSMSMIDKYAVEELGMTKVRSNQIQYMDVSEYKAARELSLAEAAAAVTAEAAEENAEDEEPAEGDEAATQDAEDAVINE